MHVSIMHIVIEITSLTKCFNLVSTKEHIAASFKQRDRWGDPESACRKTKPIMNRWLRIIMCPTDNYM